MVQPLVCQTNSRPAWLCLLCNLPRTPLLVPRSQDLSLLGLDCGSSANGPDVVKQLDHPVILLGLRLGPLSAPQFLSARTWGN